MAARLPTVGGDDGNWGQILNDFLSQSHNIDGSIKSTAAVTSVVGQTGIITGAQIAADAALTTTYAPIQMSNVVTHGAVGDGVSDDTNAFKAALSVAQAVYIPAGKYAISDTLVLSNSQRFFGDGKRVSIIKEISHGAMVGKPLVSAPIVSSSDTTSTTGYSSQGLRDIGIQYYGGARTEYPVLFMNCQQVTMTDCVVQKLSTSTDTTYDAVYFGRTTSTINGSTWADRIIGNKLYKTSLVMDQHTDSFVLDNEINCIDLAYSVKVTTGDGMRFSGNQIIGELRLGNNSGLSVENNYFDGYYKHDIPTIMNGIIVTNGTVKDSSFSGNFFFELPGYAIKLSTGGILRLITITRNQFINCDIFKNGYEDVSIVETLHSYGITIQGNVFRRDVYYTLVEGVATKVNRASGDTNRVGAIHLSTFGTGDSVYDSKCVVSGNDAAWTTGYAASTVGVNCFMYMNYPTAVFPNTGIPKTDLTSDVQGSLTNADASARSSLVSSRLSVGCETIPRLFANGSELTTSGTLRLTYFTAYQSFTAGSVRLGSSSTAAGATPTLCRIGIYSVATDGTLTLISSTANDTSLFSSTLTRYTKALSSTVAINAGSRYAVGVLVVTGAAAPTIIGQSSSSAFGSEMGENPRMAGSVSGQSDLPESVIAASVSNNYQVMYVAIGT
jgi:hypothetical protein